MVSPELTMFTLIVLYNGNNDCPHWEKPKKDAHEAQYEIGNLFIVDETLKSSKIIKIFNAESLLSNRFNASINKMAG